MADSAKERKEIDRRRAIAYNYVMNGDKIKAMVDNGYSESYAKARGYTIFAREDMRAFIEEYRAEVRERHLVSADRLINEMAKLAFVDVTDIVKVVKKQRELDDYTVHEYLDVEIKPTEEWTPEQKSAVKSIKYTKHGISVEFYSKDAALTKLGETLGIFKQNVKVSGTVEMSQEDPFQGLTTEELKALAEPKGSE